MDEPAIKSVVRTFDTKAIWVETSVNINPNRNILVIVFNLRKIKLKNNTVSHEQATFQI